MATTTRYPKIGSDSILKETAGSWKIFENGVEYVRMIRRGWISRRKRLGP